MPFPEYSCTSYTHKVKQDVYRENIEGAITKEIEGQQ